MLASIEAMTKTLTTSMSTENDIEAVVGCSDVSRTLKSMGAQPPILVPQTDARIDVRVDVDALVAMVQAMGSVAEAPQLPAVPSAPAIPSLPEEIPVDEATTKLKCE